MSDEDLGDEDMDDDAMARAMEEMGQLDNNADDSPPADTTEDDAKPAIHGVELEVSAILGTAQMPVSQMLKMGRGAVVELDKEIEDKVEISLNDRIIAEGDVIIRDEKLCIEISSLVKRTE